MKLLLLQQDHGPAEHDPALTTLQAHQPAHNKQGVSAALAWCTDNPITTKTLVCSENVSETSVHMTQTMHNNTAEHTEDMQNSNITFWTLQTVHSAWQSVVAGQVCYCRSGICC